MPTERLIGVHGLGAWLASRSQNPAAPRPEPALARTGWSGRRGDRPRLQQHEVGCRPGPTRCLAACRRCLDPPSEFGHPGRRRRVDGALRRCPAAALATTYHPLVGRRLPGDQPIAEAADRVDQRGVSVAADRIGAEGDAGRVGLDHGQHENRHRRVRPALPLDCAVCLHLLSERGGPAMAYGVPGHPRRPRSGRSRTARRTRRREDPRPPRSTERRTVQAPAVRSRRTAQQPGRRAVVSPQHPPDRTSAPTSGRRESLCQCPSGDNDALGDGKSCPLQFSKCRGLAAQLRAVLDPRVIE